METNLLKSKYPRIEHKLVEEFKKIYGYEGNWPSKLKRYRKEHFERVNLEVEEDIKKERIERNVFWKIPYGIKTLSNNLNYFRVGKSLDRLLSQVRMLF